MGAFSHIPAWCAAARKRGFSLIEIMIAVTILGLLLMIAIPAISRARDNTLMNVARREMKVIADAVELLVMDTGQWPGGSTEPGGPEMRDLNSPAAGLVTNDGRFAHWKGPYMKSIHADPWGQPYFFNSHYSVDGKIIVVVGSSGPHLGSAALDIYEDLGE